MSLKAKVHDYYDAFGDKIKALADNITEKVSGLSNDSKKALAIGAAITMASLSSYGCLDANANNVQVEKENPGHAIVQQVEVKENSVALANGQKLMYENATNTATVQLASEAEAEKALSNMQKQIQKVSDRFAVFRKDAIRISLTNDFELTPRTAYKFAGHMTKTDNDSNGNTKAGAVDMHKQYNDMHGSLYNTLANLNVMAESYGHTQAFANFVKINAEKLDKMYNSDVLGGKTAASYERSAFSQLRENVGQKLGIQSYYANPEMTQMRVDREKEITFTQRAVLNAVEKAAQNNQGLSVDDLHKAVTNQIPNYNEFNNKDFTSQTEKERIHFQKVLNGMVRDGLVRATLTAEGKLDKIYAQGFVQKVEMVQAKTPEKTQTQAPKLERV